jgi:hypothetical protein
MQGMGGVVLLLLLELVDLLLVYGILYAGSYWCANNFRTFNRLSIN